VEPAPAVGLEPEWVALGDGPFEGRAVGTAVRLGVGSEVTPGVGFDVGAGVGFGVGLAVGFGVGFGVGVGVGSGAEMTIDPGPVTEAVRWPPPDPDRASKR
jgi:hypothetical protein